MKYNELKLNKSKRSNRVGRGISAGQGKTAGRGTKGQGSRTGSSRRPGFEGGQNPLYSRIPKLRGFTSIKETTVTVTTDALNKFDGVVDNFTLYEARILEHPAQAAKVVVRGDVTKKLQVSLQGASAKAAEAIVKAGGSFTKVDRPKAAKKISEEA